MKHEFNDINLLFCKIKKILKLLLKCDNVVIGMCDNDLKEAFKIESKGITEVVAIKPNKSVISNISKLIEVAYENTKYHQTDGEEKFIIHESNYFNNFDSFMKGYRKNGKMIQCVFNPMCSPERASKFEDVFLIIQCDRKTNDKMPNSGNFILRDEISFKRLSAIITNFKASKSLQRSLSILDCFKDLTHEKNLASIFQKVQTLMPKIFCTSSCGLFFIDHKNEKVMYTVESVSKDRDGIEFVRNIIKYPVDLGFTGKSMKLKKPLVYYKQDDVDVNDNESSLPTKDFIPEVDNYVAETNLK